MPDELKRRETRLAKIKEAMRALEDEARQQESQNPKPAKAATNESPASPAAPADNAQRNFTDLDSRIMKVSSTNSFEQCYNGQTMVDDLYQVIVASNLSQRANDSEEVEPILGILEQNLGGNSAGMAITTDAGYYAKVGNIPRRKGIYPVK